MALPLRVEARFRLDLPAGQVKFEMRVPDASMIASLFDKSEQEAAALAERYARQVGLLLVDIAMRSSARIERVDLVARTIGRDGSEDVDLFSASFDRDLYERSKTGSLKNARAIPQPSMKAFSIRQQVRTSPKLHRFQLHLNLIPMQNSHQKLLRPLVQKRTATWRYSSTLNCARQQSALPMR